MPSLVVLSIIIHGWLVDSATHFHDYIRKAFRGDHVFQITLSQIHREWEPHSHDHYDTNVELYKIWKDIFIPVPSSSKHLHHPLQEWFLIDQWAINEGREFLYNDRIHFAGPLTDASLQQIMNSMCPGEGIDLSFPSTLPLTTDIVGKLLFVSKSDETISPNNRNNIDRDRIMHLDSLPYEDKQRNAYDYYTVDKADIYINISTHLQVAFLFCNILVLSKQLTI